MIRRWAKAILWTLKALMSESRGYGELTLTFMGETVETRTFTRRDDGLIVLNVPTRHRHLLHQVRVADGSYGAELLDGFFCELWFTVYATSRTELLRSWGGWNGLIKCGDITYVIAQQTSVDGYPARHYVLLEGVERDS